MNNIFTSLSRVLFFSTVIFINLYSQEQVKVLFVGNSLTYSNDLPGMFKELAVAGGKDVFVDGILLGGVTLREHSTNVATINKINERGWDYVILQSDDITAFSDMYHLEMNALTVLRNVIHGNNPSTEIIYEMIWGLKNGVNVPGEQYYTYEEYMDKIYNGTLYIANRMDMMIAPVGSAWQRAREERPELDLFARDEAHPAREGSYLGACVFFSLIFNEHLNSNSYQSFLTADVSLFLQNIASDIVLSNYTLWRPVTCIENEKEEVDISFASYPNPFNLKANIYVKLVREMHVQILIFDSLGRKIKILIDEQLAKGYHVFSWDAKRCSSGNYFALLQADEELRVNKLVLLK
jgi:hypothetical protein